MRLPDLRAQYPPRRLLTLLGVAVAYFIGAKLGLRLAFVNASATAVWPPTGIAIAAVLILGQDVWPVIFLAAFAVNLTTAGTVLTSAGIAVGNTLEALAAGYQINRYAGGRMPFAKADNAVKYVLMAGTVCTMISPTIGVITLGLGGLASWAEFGRVWSTWWLGDAVGALVVAPVILLWQANPRLGWSGTRVVEVIALFATVTATGAIVFGGFFPSDVQNYPLDFICILPLLWAAYRFGPRKTATATLLLSAIAVAGTLNYYGPFVRGTPHESLVLLQSYTAIVAATALTLAAVLVERRVMEARLHELSITDPLTGLANYRLLIERLYAERARSLRTRQPFSILFLDLDGLKKINDKHGHLTGSRALVRVAAAIRASCREMDTLARYGGDEFAIILPETEPAEAQRIAERIHGSLARDLEIPAVSVSLGIATYPDHGDSPEALLSAADRSLYAMKEKR